MITLRIGPGSGGSLHRRDGGLPASGLPRSADTLTATEACPRCKRGVTAHRFTTGDGLPIVTYRCAEHGNVIPMRSIVVHDQ